jgi:hypothetical protein
MLPIFGILVLPGIMLSARIAYPAAFRGKAGSTKLAGGKLSGKFALGDAPPPGDGGGGGGGGGGAEEGRGRAPSRECGRQDDRQVLIVPGGAGQPDVAAVALGVTRSEKDRSVVLTPRGRRAIVLLGAAVVAWVLTDGVVPGVDLSPVVVSLILVTLLHAPEPVGVAKAATLRAAPGFGFLLYIVALEALNTAFEKTGLVADAIDSFDPTTLEAKSI